MLYQLETGGVRLWKEIGDLCTDYIHLVIAFEKEKKAGRHGAREEVEEEGLTGRQFRAEDVRRVIFAGRRGEQLVFRVHLRGGERVMASSRQIREWSPQVLIDFYEQHLEVGFDL